MVCIPCLLTGGTEVQTLALVWALRDAGHDVAVACYFEYCSEMAARYRRAGAELFLLSAEGVGRPRGALRQTRFLLGGLRRVVREFRPDAAHVQYMAPGAIPVIVLRMLGVKRVMATLHTDASVYTPRGLKLVRLLTRHALTAMQCITLRAESNFFGNARIFSPDMPRQRQGNHFTIPNALPGHIRIRSEQAERPAGFPLIMGVVSRLEHIKGMDLVVPAFAEVAATDPQVRLLVAGDGSQRTLMERQARELGVAERVEFLGMVAADSLEAVYDRIDVLIVPSRSEGFGLTAIEGMARGCVVVASDTGGLPEVVTHGSGFLFPSEDQGALTARLKEIAADPQLRLRTAEGAIKRAADFSFFRYSAAIGALYSLIPKP